MRSIATFLAGIFSFVYIDLNLFRKTSQGILLKETVSLEYSKTKEKLKRKQRRYKNKKYKRRKFYQQKHYKLKGTHSKDSRYSNQRDIRRMHTSYA